MLPGITENLQCSRRGSWLENVDPEWDDIVQVTFPENILPFPDRNNNFSYLDIIYFTPYLNTYAFVSGTDPMRTCKSTC
jgi:hypothetical protein